MTPTKFFYKPGKMLWAYTGISSVESPLMHRTKGFYSVGMSLIPDIFPETVTDRFSVQSFVSPVIVRVDFHFPVYFA